MAGNIIKNPFVECTARDMRYEEVRQYWCSPFNLYKLDEDELFTSRTPIVIEGIRGTGKTMILKYLSYYVQRDFVQGESVEDKLKYFEHRSMGVYFRYKEDFCNLFEDLECSFREKERIFKYYYELFIIRQIIDILSDFYDGQDTKKVETVVCSFLGISNRTLAQANSYVNRCLREVDRIINTASYNSSWERQIDSVIKSGNMINEFIRSINQSLPGWENVLFSISLDEYENLGEFQKLINTFLKQVDDTVNLTYRIGMRPAGMDYNNKTYVADESLQVDRDFLLKHLEYENMREYRKFAKQVSQKRLENVEIYSGNGLCDLKLILGPKEDFDSEANSVAKGTKQFDLLKQFFDENTMEDVINELSCDEKLMEMYNILRVLRGEDYKNTGKLSRQYRTSRDSKENIKTLSKELKKYWLDYSNKYRVALLYVLISVYGKKKLYYSVNTFLYLSSGSINDFISLCRNVFKHIDDTMLDDLKKGEIISPKLQTNAALDTAEDQRRKVTMGNRHGKEIDSFIEGMGRIFEAYHKDRKLRYPETNQFAFENEREIRDDEELNECLTELINSGVIIRKKRRSLKSVGKDKGYIYQLNRIFAPLYQFSYRTRGGFNYVLDKETFSNMLKGIYPKINDCQVEQLSLFDYEDR